MCGTRHYEWRRKTNFDETAGYRYGVIFFDVMMDSPQVKLMRKKSAG